MKRRDAWELVCLASAVAIMRFRDYDSAVKLGRMLARHFGGDFHAYNDLGQLVVTESFAAAPREGRIVG